MEPLAAAHRFMDLFYGGSREGIRELELILAPDLAFHGPYRAFGSAREYIDALLTSPPAGMTFEIVASFASEDAACLVYDFHKAGVTTTMAQYFQVRNGLIAKIILVFDTSAFADQEGNRLIQEPIILDGDGGADVFRTREEAERYVEPEDIRNGVYKAYDALGRVLAIEVAPDGSAGSLTMKNPWELRAAELEDVLRLMLRNVAAARSVPFDVDRLDDYSLDRLVEFSVNYYTR